MVTASDFAELRAKAAAHDRLWTENPRMAAHASRMTADLAEVEAKAGAGKCWRPSLH